MTKPITVQTRLRAQTVSLTEVSPSTARNEASVQAQTLCPLTGRMAPFAGTHTTAAFPQPSQMPIFRWFSASGLAIADTVYGLSNNRFYTPTPR